MNIKATLLGMISASIAVAAPEVGSRLDLELKDGTKHANSRITAIEPDRLIIINSGGVFTIRNDDLSPESQKAIGWSKEVSDAHKDRIAQIEAEEAKIRTREAKIAELTNAIQSITIEAQVYILQVTDSGFLCKGGSGVFGPTKKRERVFPGRPAQYIDDEITQTETHPGLNGPTNVTKVIKYRKLVSPEVKDRVESYTYRDSYPFSNLFFVEAPTAGYVDGGVWSGMLWPDGTHAYVNTLGARATVERFTSKQPEIVKNALAEIERLRNEK